MTFQVNCHSLKQAGAILFWVFLSFLACPSSGHARGFVDDDTVIKGADIIEYGIYEADRLGKIDTQDTSTGILTIVNENTIRLVEKTTKVPAVIGIRFGISYIVDGSPDNAEVELTIRVITPGLSKPPAPAPQMHSRQGVMLGDRRDTGISRTTEQWPSRAYINKQAYNFFNFEYDWELVPGTWTFQIWTENRMLAEQSFDVVPAAKEESDADVAPPVGKVIEYLSSSECTYCLRAIYMVKVLGKEAAPALPYLIKKLNSYSTESQIAFDCGCAKETPAAIAAVGDISDSLIDNLASSLWTVREGAKKSLLLMGAPAIESLIKTATGGRNLDTRRYATLLLGEFKEDYRILPCLTGLLKNDYFPEIRHAALETMEKRKDTSCIPAVAEALENDKAAPVRRKAAETLGTIRDPQVIGRLIEAYRKHGEEWEVRETALISLLNYHDLARISPLVKEALQDHDPLKRLVIVQAISASGSENYGDVLGSGLSDPDVRVREAALEGLIKNKASAANLRAGLSSSDNKIRASAICEMSRRGDPTAMELLPPLLKNSNLNTRLEAALIFAMKKDGRAFEPLIEIARLRTSGSENTDLAASAIRGLGVLGDIKALGLILEAARAENSYVAEAAFEALGMMPNPDSAKFLIEYIAEDHMARHDYRYAARNSLIKLGEQSVVALLHSLKTAGGRRLLNINNVFKYIVKAVGRPSIPHLASAVKSPIIEVKKNAAEALSMFKEEEAASILATTLFDRELRYDSERYLRQIGQPAIKPLLSLINEKDEEVRFSVLTVLGSLGEKRAFKPLQKVLTDVKRMNSAIEALGGIKEPRAAKALLPFLNDENVNVRIQTVSSLGLIGDKMAINPLIDMLNAEKGNDMQSRLIEALGNLRARAASQLITEFLRNGNDQMRITAASSLFNIAEPDSAAALVDALDDRESIVRDYAYKALKEITRADCGIYPDAWRLWLERNSIPAPIDTEQNEIGIIKVIIQFWANLLTEFWSWLTNLIH